MPSEVVASVVIATYNQAAYLAECINSALAQNYDFIEVIVVDGASTDNTQDVLAGFGTKIVVVSVPNSGPSAARNAGSERAVGEFIVYLDGDDRLDPACVSERVAMLRADPTSGLVVGSLRIINTEGNLIRVDPIVNPPRTEISFDQAVMEMNCPTCGLAVRKEALKVMGGWDEGLWMAEDSDLLIRFAAKFICLVDNEPRADYRQIGSSLSKNPALMFDSYAQMLRKNRSVAPDKAKYDRLANRAFRERMANNIFGSILKDSQPNKLNRMLSAMWRRPPLVGVAIYWGFRGVRNRAQKLLAKNVKG